MEIMFREIDFEKDATAVVTLINENLKSGFTDDILKWKHLYGAFGPSHNVLAVDGEKIVAVVFAMRYNYLNGNGELIKGIRTFDGCTDPAYRGMGIFKKLMKACVDKFSMDYQFLMANPNEASYPEHIKLGYVVPEFNYYYKFGIVNPFGSNLNERIEDFKKIPPEKNDYPEEVISEGEQFITGNSLKFLNWRYQPENYIIKKITINNTDSYIAYRRIKKKGINLIVLCDYYGNKKKLARVVRSICKLERTYFLYYLDNALNSKLNLFVSRKDKHAVIVFKLNDFNLPNNLMVSLGDLEGRL